MCVLFIVVDAAAAAVAAPCFGANDTVCALNLAGRRLNHQPTDGASGSISTELLSQPKVLTLSRGDPTNPSVFIAIGSAPKKHGLRDTVRSTWLTRCLPPSCGYRFFTDSNVTLEDTLGGRRVAGVPADVVTTPAEEGGYANFGIRALEQLRWSLRHVDFDHYLRLDDDGLLCLDHLQHDLRQLPLKRLFWGKFWCQHMVRQRASLPCCPSTHSSAACIVPPTIVS